MGLTRHINLDMPEKLFLDIKKETQEKGIKVNPYIREVLKMRHNLESFPQIVDLLIKLLKDSKKWKN